MAQSCYTWIGRPNIPLVKSNASRSQQTTMHLFFHFSSLPRLANYLYSMAYQSGQSAHFKFIAVNIGK